MGVMMSEGCVFCEIINRRMSASIVYEDESVIAIMDLHQANPGHVLVIPKHHFPNIYALSEEAGCALMRCLIVVSRAVRQVFAAEGLNIWQSNGACAGQEVLHVHFHIQPRKRGDGLLRVYAARPRSASREVLDRYAAKIREHLSGDKI